MIIHSSTMSNALFLANTHSQIRSDELVSMAGAFARELERLPAWPNAIGLHTANPFESVLIMTCCWICRIPFVPFDSATHLAPELFGVDVVIYSGQPAHVPQGFTQFSTFTLNQQSTTTHSTTTPRPSLYFNADKPSKPGVPHRITHDLFSAPNELFCGLLTSGSAGFPKKVPLSRRQMMSAALATASSGIQNKPSSSGPLSNAYIQPGCTQFWGHCLPLTHAGGIAIVFRALLNAHGVWLWDRFDAHEVYHDITKNEHISHISLVPTMLVRLLDACEQSLTAPAGLKDVLLGGGPASASLLCRARKLGWPVRMSYGMTETCAQIAAQPIPGYEPVDSVGPVFGSHSWRICDTAGNQLPAGQTGLLRIKGPQVFRGYLRSGVPLAPYLFMTQKENASSASDHRTALDTTSHDNQGYFITGDFARTDIHGNLYIEARRTDIVVSGGKNVSVTVVEQFLASIPGVKDAAVTWVPDTHWGQLVVALIVPAEPRKFHELVQTLQEQASQKLNPHERPRHYLQAGIIPRTSLGKIRRKALQTLTSGQIGHVSDTPA